MSQNVDDALAGVQEAAKQDGMGRFFLAVRDQDSDKSHCRIFGGMNAGFAMAHMALAGNGYALREDHAPRLWAALSKGMEATGIKTWFFCCIPDADKADAFMPLAAYASPDGSAEAFGIGVGCLQMMLTSYVSKYSFSQGGDENRG